MNAPRIAVVGAGLELAGDVVARLVHRGLDAERIRLLDDEETAGEVVEIGDIKRKVEWASPQAVADVDVALFCGNERLTRELLPAVRAAGGVSIDVTPFSRGGGEARLVVPEVNPARLGRVARGAVLASPSPAGVGMALALAPLHRAAGVRRVVATVFEPAAQRGAGAVEELSRQSIQLMHGRGLDRSEFPEQLAFNLRVQAAAVEGGWSADEQALARELPVLLDAPALSVAATVVRVPVFFGSAQALHLELGREVELAEVETAIRGAQGLLLAGSVEDRLAMAVETTRRHREHVSRASGPRHEEEEPDEAEELEEDGLEEIDEDAADEGERDGGDDQEGDEAEGEKEVHAAGAARSRAGLVPDLQPGPVEVGGSEFVHVSRLRLDPRRPGGLALWISFDEMRRGVALNLVSILELVLRTAA